jgi:glycerol-3-phosphate dehydrogenase
VYTIDDVLGAEMCGALKNVYAIAVGISRLALAYRLRGVGSKLRATLQPAPAQS